MILVTGANGFVGRSVVLELLKSGQRVVGVDRRPAMYPAEVAGKDYDEQLIDLTDQAAVAALIDAVRPTTIIALAESADGAPADFVARGVCTLHHLLVSADAAGVKRVCFASSLTVYLGLAGPFTEDMALSVCPALHISAMKMGEEIEAHWYARNSGMEVVAMRLANIYGPRYSSMMNTPSRYLFGAIGREIPPRPSLDKSIYDQLADFCHVEDCAHAIGLIATAPELTHRIYNVGGGQGVTDAMICRAVEGSGPDPLALPTQNYLAVDRLGGELGYAPVHDIYSGMAHYRAWLEKHEF